MRLLRDREFLRFFGAQAISMFGDRMVTVALAFAVLQLGGSATDVGTVLAARGRAGTPRSWPICAAAGRSFERGVGCGRLSCGRRWPTFCSVPTRC